MCVSKPPPPPELGQGGVIQFKYEGRDGHWLWCKVFLSDIFLSRTRILVDYMDEKKCCSLPSASNNVNNISYLFLICG